MAHVQEGASIANLAEQYGKHYRTIQRWIARGKAEEWDKEPIVLELRRRA